MKKVLVILFVVLIVAFPMFATGATEEPIVDTIKTVADTKAIVYGPNSFGNNVKYDPDVPVNNGDPISIDFWMWGDETLFGKIGNAYSAIHPNVTINLINNPYDDYWTKLPLMLKGDKGPALFNIHNKFHQIFINYCAPYDIPLEDLQADFTGVSSHIKDNKVYYIDYGLMSSSVYYNKDMWKAAGLTESDIPKTWDELREVAKKLTIWQNGTLLQAGFNINDCISPNFLIGINYQKGQTLFSEDGKTCVIDNDVTKENFNMALDFYNKDKVGSKDFGDSGTDSFGQEQSAMTIGWGWYGSYLAALFPDINFGVFEIPTSDENPVAYHRYNGESTFGINKNADKKSQAIAQDIIRFFLANNELQKAFNQAMYTFPAKKELERDSEILSLPACKALADHIDRYIWPGPMPTTVEDNMKICVQDVLYNGVSIDDALANAQKRINEDLKNSDFVAVENKYAYSSELNY